MLTKEGSHPVNPVVDTKIKSNQIRAEGPGRIQAASGIVDTGELGHEQREANDQGGNAVALVLLDGHEEDGHQQLHCQQRLDHQALEGVGTVAQLSLDHVGAREGELDDEGGGDGAEELADGEEDALEPVHLANEGHA